MKKFITNKYVLYILGICFLFLIWYLGSISFNNAEMILPSPIKTGKVMVELLGQKSTYTGMLFSLSRLFIGFIISFACAFVLGLIVNDNESLYNFFAPIITVIKSIPTASIVFLFVVLSGSKNAPILVVFTVTFPILYESVVKSLQTRWINLVEVAETDGANKFKRIFKIQLPVGLPYIFLGLVSSFSLAFKVEIMAEVITGYTRGGLGSLIKNSQVLNPTDLTEVFAYSLMAIILILLITLIAQIIKRYLTEKFDLKLGN